MLKDLKRFNYVLKDECGVEVIISSKYIFDKYDIEEFVQEARDHYCYDLLSIENYLIENHEFERFKIEIEFEV